MVLTYGVDLRSCFTESRMDECAFRYEFGAQEDVVAGFGTGNPAGTTRPASLTFSPAALKILFDVFPDDAL